jgi:SAM-dependent methyltransferase
MIIVMNNTELERQIDALSQELCRDRGSPSAVRLKQLYELIGLSMQHRYGVEIEHNPCSVTSISSTVLKMAKEIAPCRILNVGMGGYPFVDIELIKRGFSVTGVEYSQSLTVLAREVSRHRGCEFQCLVADGMRLPFQDGSFEACLCSETVEHVSDDTAVIREIHRILKPDGTLLFTVPCIVSLLGLTKRFVHYIRNRKLVMHPTHLREYTYFSAKRLVSEYFSIQRWYHVPFVTEPFRKMPYENILSLLVGLPILAHFSLSFAFLLTKRRDEV